MKRARPLFEKETDLAPVAEAFFREAGFDVYREVVLRAGNRADLVGVAGPVLCVVELKLRLGLDVLAQARRHVPYAHQVWVAAPIDVPKDRETRRLLIEVADWKGIGVLTCSPDQGPYWPAQQRVEIDPAFNRTAQVSRVRELLREEQKTVGIAGSASGGHYTSFRGTCGRLAKFVAENPGCSFRDAIGAIDHHYATASSARSTLARLIKSGVVNGVRIEQDGRQIRCYPTEAKP